MEMVAQLRESQVVSENGQEKVVDLSKASREATSSTSNFSSVTSKFILPNVSTPVSDAFKTQMELLQAGLSRTPTRHLLNGSLIDGEPPMKRRRGRRKNVEGLDLLFMSNKRTSLTVVRPQPFSFCLIFVLLSVVLPECVLGLIILSLIETYRFCPTRFFLCLEMLILLNQTKCAHQDFTLSFRYLVLSKLLFFFFTKYISNIIHFEA